MTFDMAYWKQMVKWDGEGHEMTSSDGSDYEEAKALADTVIIVRYFEQQLGMEPGEVEMVPVSTKARPGAHAMFEYFDMEDTCWEGHYGAIINLLRKAKRLHELEALLDAGWSRLGRELIERTVRGK